MAVRAVGVTVAVGMEVGEPVEVTVAVARAAALYPSEIYYGSPSDEPPLVA